MSLSDFATNVAQSTQAAVLDYIAEHGRARGLCAFARAVGVSERRARSLAEGSAGRIDACEYLAAQHARAALLRQRIARAEHNLHIIEALHGDLDLAQPEHHGLRTGEGAGALGRGLGGAGGPIAGAA